MAFFLLEIIDSHYASQTLTDLIFNYNFSKEDLLYVNHVLFNKLMSLLTCPLNYWQEIQLQGLRCTYAVLLINSLALMIYFYKDTNSGAESNKPKRIYSANAFAQGFQNGVLSNG